MVIKLLMGWGNTRLPDTSFSANMAIQSRLGDLAYRDTGTYLTWQTLPIKKEQVPMGEQLFDCRYHNTDLER